MKRFVTFTRGAFEAALGAALVVAFGAALTALVAFCFTGCVMVNLGGVNSVRGQGNLERYEVTVGEFESVKAEGAFELVYNAAASDIVVLEVQPNLREYYTIEVINGTLVISTKRGISINTNKTPVVTISTPRLGLLDLKGAGTFTARDTIRGPSFTLSMSGVGSGSATVDVDSLAVKVSGTGSIDLAGRADSAGFSLSGTGKILSLPLATLNSNVTLSGTGSIKLSCADSLRINASGTGSIEYRGNPRVDISSNGMVSIKRID